MCAGKCVDITPDDIRLICQLIALEKSLGRHIQVKDLDNFELKAEIDIDLPGCGHNHTRLYLAVELDWI